MIARLETTRLELRPLELADAEQTQRLFPKWEIVRFLANHVPWPYPDDGALTYYRDSALPAMARGEAWHWSLRLKSDPHQLIGSVSVMKAENNNRGGWLGLPWQRKGLMSEAAEVVNRLLVQRTQLFGDARSESSGEHGFQEDFRKRTACALLMSRKGTT